MKHHEGKRGPGSERPTGPIADARGGIRLVVDGTRRVTSVVEALHGQILRLAPPLRRRPPTGNDAVADALADSPGRPADGLPPTRGITGFVYRSIQGGTRLVGDGLDGLLAPFDEAMAGAQPSPRRDAMVAALNGVLGDHLLRSGNPLALPMQLRQGGRPLDLQAPGSATSGHVLLLVHGLCMSDLGWRRNGHDHGELLSRALGAVPVYAFYNSGLHISRNGLALAELLEQLVQQWPVPLQRLTIIGHSMGGLVARSACAQAAAAGHRWPARLRQLAFLGTPHHGAPLERAGNWLHRVMDLSPYAAPFTRLSRLRSEGITDLRHGNLLEADWQGAGRFEHGDRRTPVPLPEGVDCYAIAATVGGPDTAGSPLGDGLVMVDSALGRHRRAALRLALPDDHCWVGRGMHHLDLLSDPAVYRKLLAWLQP
jgi:hypothetical protein